MNGSPIIASLSPINFKRFFDGVSGSPAIVSQIQTVDPALPYDKLAEKINACRSEILLTGWGSVPLPECFLKDCPTVRYVCHLTGELRWLLPRRLIEEGLLVTNWGSVISDCVAEGALFLILASLRRATNAAMTMHVRKGWELSVADPQSLLDKRVGIHGFGNIAQQLTLLLQPFRCKISSYSPPVPDLVFQSFSTERENSLENLFRKNDIVVEVDALTNQTRGLIGLDLLKRIRPGGIFVNAGRGKVVREKDLEEVARQGEIFIGLDVYDEEPLPPDSPLRGLENVFLVPHLAGPTPDRYKICAGHALENIQAYQQGKPLCGMIGVSEYDRIT
jgi:phosphoglycerate dehydrogenase-like enzyme